MVFDRDVIICVTPDKYRNDVYDIANLFYKNVIRRRAEQCAEAEPADTISVSDAGEHIEIRLERPSPDCSPNFSIVNNLAKNRDAKTGAYELKMALYRMLKSCSNDILPWGALVGIRPVKLYASLLNRGMSGAEAAAHMAVKYDVPAKTSRLCIEIADAQRDILQNCDPRRDYLLYVGIPFCRTKCGYCSFSSDAHNRADKYAKPYVDALLRELRFAVGRMERAGRRAIAVYIGGGTPTALDCSELARLLESAAELLSGERPEEFTVEAGRADTIDRQKLAAIYEITQSVLGGAAKPRICVNPQTMNRETLRRIGREHTPEDVIDAFRLAREAGFDNINMDVIAGLPEETAADFVNTLEAVSELKPESVTVHTLCIKRSSRFNEFSGMYAYPDARTVEAMRDAAAVYAGRMGMKPYYLYRQKNTAGNFENTGYAPDGYACIYNVHEMADSADVIAVGAGGASKFTDAASGRIERVFNVKNLLAYIDRVDEMIRRKDEFFTKYMNI